MSSARRYSGYCEGTANVDSGGMEEAVHMGILRSAETQETAVTYNTQKARRTVYSLMGSSLHGENGLDPETPVHLLQTYVIPVLVYELELY